MAEAEAEAKTLPMLLVLEVWGSIPACDEKVSEHAFTK